jgi:diguanylate cyclase (GGDEF)-like protein
MVAHLVQNNFLNLLIIFVFYFFLHSENMMEKKCKLCFAVSAVAINLLMYTDIADYCLLHGSGPGQLRYLTCGLGFALRLVPLALMVGVTGRYPPKRICWIHGGALVNGLIALSSAATHWVFWIDEVGEYHSGPLYWVPIFFGLGYMAALVLMVLGQSEMGGTLEGDIVLVAAVSCILGLVAKNLFGYRSVLSGAMALSLFAYYLFLHTNIYKRDAMTGALNRHSFYADSEGFAGKRGVLVSIDLNNLKTINDTQGHSAGDQAIITVARTLIREKKPTQRAYRMGGDEFALLCPSDSTEQVEAMMERVAQQIHEAGYEIAWGMAEYAPGESLDQMFSVSDERMYECKRRMKAVCSQANRQSLLP